MKSIVILLLLSIFINGNLFAQHYTEEVDYYQRSNRQKTISLAFGIAGGALFTAGFIVYLREGNPYYNSNYASQNSNKGQMLAYVGGALMVVAIPFQIMSNSNRKRAMSVGLMDMRVPVLQQQNIVRTFTPSIGLKIGL